MEKMNQKSASGPKCVLISILIPTYNEEKFIEQCLQSVSNFILPPEIKIEVFIIDGCSEDSTPFLIKKFIANRPNYKLLINPKRFQSAALNMGIKNSKGQFIARLDAHTIYPNDYIQNCYAISESIGADNVGGLCTTLPGDDGLSAALVQALTTHKFGVGNSGFRVGATAGYVDTVPFGFFKRSTFKKIGTFNELLIRTQDYEFNKRITSRGGAIYLDPNIKSSYFNQKSLRKFFSKQFRLQGPYNIYMWYVAPYTFNLRHAATGTFVLFLFSGAIIPVFGVYTYLWVSVVFIYIALAMLSSIQQAIRYKKSIMLLLLPPLFFTFHFCHGLGMWRGITKLIFRKAPVN